MRKIIYSIIMICLLFIPLFTVDATWNNIETKEEFKTTIERDTVTVPICYNNNTSTKYIDLNVALENAKSGEYIYVYIGSKIDITQNIIINSGVHLVLPFIGKSNDDTAEEIGNISSNPLYKISSADDRGNYGNLLGYENETNVSNYRSILVNMRNGADILNYGYLHLGGAHTTQGNNGYYSEINLGKNSSIICNSGSTFDCYGLVKEFESDYMNPTNDTSLNNANDTNRYLHLKEGSTMNTYLALYDCGERSVVTTLIDANQSPFSTFDFQAVQTYFVIDSGSNFNADALIVGPGGTTINKSIPIARKNSSETAFFYINEGCMTLENYQKGDVRYSSRDITKSKTILRVDGNVSLGYINVTEGVGSYKVNLDTRLLFLPISCKLDIHLTDSSIFYTDKKVKFLLGSSLTIDQNATFEVNNKVTFYTKSNAPAYDANENIFYSYSGEDANLIVNGNIVINTDGLNNGAIAGIAKHNSNNNSGLLDFSDISSKDNMSVTSEEGISGKQIIQTIQGYYYNENTTTIELANFIEGNTYSSSKHNNEYVWEGQFTSSSKIKINVVEGITNPIISYSLFQSSTGSDSDSSVILEQQQSSTEKIIDNGTYFKITSERIDSITIINDDTKLSYSTNEWIYVNGDYTITITPSEGVGVTVVYEQDPSATNTNTDWQSGTGHVIYHIYESDTEDGIYTEVAQIKLKNKSEGENAWFFANVRKDKYFKITWSIDNYTLYYKGVNKNALIELNGQTYTEKTYNPYARRESAITLSSWFKATGKYVFTIYWNYDSSCIPSGTLLTLADGTQKKVEDLLDTDMLLVFNHETGRFEASPIIFVDRDEWKNYKIVNLEFSNGTKTRLIYEHGYFDLTLNKYVYITESNYQDYIGHEFAFYDGDKVNSVTLANSYITNEYVGCYSPVTAYHLNYIVDGYISMPGGIEGLFNIFEYNNDMTYNIEKMNEDIEKYGLYTYEDFKDYLPYEVYLAFPGPYLKISVEKGYITFEEIIGYIEQYLGRHGLDK